MVSVRRSSSGNAAGGFPGAYDQPTSLYNAGNDDVENVNRFTFPAVSFSPSLLSPRSPAGVLAGFPRHSPRGEALLSPLAASSRSNSQGSGSPISSPLPPLSPRGIKFCQAVKSGERQNKTRIVERRRKASDGTQEIVYMESPACSAPTTLSHPGHARKVSFKLFGERNALPTWSLPASLPSPSGATIGSRSNSRSPSPMQIRLSGPDDIMEYLDSTPGSPILSP